MSEENIFAKVPGQYLSATMHEFPNPETVADGTTMEGTVDIPGIGLVRVTFERMKHKRAKQVHYWWAPSKAVFVVA